MCEKQKAKIKNKIKKNVRTKLTNKKMPAPVGHELRNLIFG